MKLDAWMPQQPPMDRWRIVGRQVIQHHMDLPLGLDTGVDVAEERDKVLGSMLWLAPRDHLAGRHVQRGRAIVRRAYQASDVKTATRLLSVSNSLSGRHWELGQVPAVGDPTDIVQLGTGHRVGAPGELVLADLIRGQKRVQHAGRLTGGAPTPRPTANRSLT